MLSPPVLEMDADTGPRSRFKSLDAVFTITSTCVKEQESLRFYFHGLFK